MAEATRAAERFLSSARLRPATPRYHAMATWGGHCAMRAFKRSAGESVAKCPISSATHSAENWFK
eukprot:2894905-Pyramimonas_sp.AAC.1